MLRLGRVLYGDDREVARWVVDRVPDMPTVPEKMAALGVLGADGDLIGGVIYHDLRGRDIMVSIAASSPRWATPKTMAQLFYYPFGQLGCTRITTLVAVSNMRSARFCKGLGFTQEGRLRKAAADGGDTLVFGMLRDECRFIRGMMING